MDKVLTALRLCSFCLFVNYGQGITDEGQWLVHEETEYLFSTYAIQWHQAAETCGKHEATLLVITSENMNDFLTPLTIGRSRWLGLRKSNNLCTCQDTNTTVCDSCRNSLTWYDGTPMVYSNWNVGRPRSHDDCNVLTGGGSWAPNTCWYNDYFVCQRGRRLRLGRSEYILGSSSTWHDAQIECINLGAHLAVITSGEERRHLENLGVWIGLRQDTECACDQMSDSSCTECRNSWVWNDGTPMQYQAWADGQPKYIYDECGYVTPNGFWKSVNCQGQHSYLCERELRSHCLSEPCQNDGLCQEDGDTYTCYCAEPFAGRQCDQLFLPSSQDNVTMCSSNPCMNGGLCYLKGESYACLCPGFYGGANCEENLEPDLSSESSDLESSNIGWIIGISVLAVLLLIVSIVAMVFILRSCRTKREEIKDTKKQYANNGYELPPTSTAVASDRASYLELSPDIGNQ